MLTVTDGALRHLAEVLAERDSPEGTVVRCVADDGTLALVPDEEQPGDTVFRFDDRAVFVVENELVEALDGHEFDVETTEDGTGLTLR